MEVILRKKVSALQCILESISVIKGRNLAQESHSVRLKCFFYRYALGWGRGIHNLESWSSNYITDREFYETISEGKCNEAMSNHRLYKNMGS